MKPIVSPVSYSVGMDVTATYLNSIKAAIDALVADCGAKATTTVAQAVTAATVFALTNNGGANVWGATEDTDGFLTGTGGTNTPIVIPAGLGGRYQVGVQGIFPSAVNERRFAEIRLNGASNVARFNMAQEQQVNSSVPLRLNAGDSLGINMFTNGGTTAQVGCQIYCYRIGN